MITWYFIISFILLFPGVKYSIKLIMSDTPGVNVEPEDVLGAFIISAIFCLIWPVTLIGGAIWFTALFIAEEYAKSLNQKSKTKDDLEAYCVVCREKTIMVDKTMRVSDTGRQTAMGSCSRCGAKVNKIMGKI